MAGVVSLWLSSRTSCTSAEGCAVASGPESGAGWIVVRTAYQMSAAATIVPKMIHRTIRAFLAPSVAEGAFYWTSVTLWLTAFLIVVVGGFTAEGKGFEPSISVLSDFSIDAL